MQITNKTEHDPIADYPMADASMRWALEAAEEVVGKDGLAVVLRQNGLERFIGNYPPDSLDLTAGIMFNDYANFNAGLLGFFGRPGKSMMLRVGRISARKGIEHQSGVFNLATLIAAKLMPSGIQVKMGLSAMMAGLRTLAEQGGVEFKGSIEDRGDKFAFILETCALCAGKQSEHHICWMHEALMEEAFRQVFGKFFDVIEIECRAMGAPACVFEVAKQPSDEATNKSAT